MSHAQNASDIEARMAEALTLLETGQDAAATHIYEEIVQQEPNFMPAIFQLGIIAMAKYDMMQAIYYLEQANKLAPDQIMIITALGTAYKDHGQYEQAYPLLKAAAEQNPNAQSHYHFAHLCALTGDFAEAAHHYQETIAHDPHHVLAFASLAQCHTWSKEDDFIDAIAACDAEITDAAPLPRATLKFAYAKVLEDAGDYAAAFDQLQKAHALKQQDQPLPEQWIEQHQQNTDDMIKYMTACKMKKAAGFRSDAKNLVFIVGMPQSSTSTAQIQLSLHDTVCDLGETSFFQETIPFDQAPEDADSLRAQLNHIMTGDAVQKIAEDYLEKVTAHAGDDAIYVDSLPFNFFWVGLIKIAFPHAKIIYCRRNFLDVGLDIFQRDEAAPYVWMHQLDTIAAMINSSEQLYQHWCKLFGDDIYTFQFEKFVENPIETAKDLYDFCGLTWDDGFALDTSGYETDIWQKYAKELKPLADKIHGY